METYRPAFVNFPRTHPLYQHHDAKVVDAADLVLMVDAVTPWYPASKGPKNAKVISIAEEFPNSRLPYWGYNVDLALAAPPAATLEQLVKKAQIIRARRRQSRRLRTATRRSIANSTTAISASSKTKRASTPTTRPSIRAGSATPSAKRCRQTP